MVFFNLKHDTFLVYKTILRITGVWPPDRDETGSVIIFSVFLTLEILNIMSRLIDPHGNCPAYKLGGPEFLITSWFATCIAMRLIFRANARRMMALIESTTDDWSSITDSRDREIMKRHDKFGSLVFVTTIAFIFLPVAQSARSLLLPARFPSPDQRLGCAFLDHHRFNAALAVVSIIVNVFDQLTIIMTESLFWSFAMHLSAQLKILKRRFRTSLLIEGKKPRRREFRRLVDRHNELLDLSGDLEDSLGLYVGLHATTMQILICLCASQLGYAIKAMELARIIDVLKNLVFLLGTPCLYYYAGDRLATSCEEIGEVFAQCNWYDLSKSSMTDFGIVIARSRVPRTLTFWKFHHLNLSNLKYTLKAIYSYVSMIVAITRE